MRAAKLCGSFVLCEGHVSRSRSPVRCVIGNSHLFMFMCVRVCMRVLCHCISNTICCALEMASINYRANALLNGVGVMTVGVGEKKLDF